MPESLEAGDNLPEPNVLASDTSDNLGTAMGLFKSVQKKLEGSYQQGGNNMQRRWITHVIMTISGCVLMCTSHAQQSTVSAGKTSNGNANVQLAVSSSVSNRALRQVSWGMTQKDVATNENGTLISQTNNCMMYKAASGNMACLLRYEFKDAKLVRADLAFALPQRSDLLLHKTADEYLDDYKLLRDALKNKYGDCAERIDNAVPDTKRREAQINHQQEEIADLEKKRSDLRVKQRQEASLRSAHNIDARIAGERQSSSDETKARIDFDNKQKAERDRLDEQLQTEKERLEQMKSATPMTGWSKYESKWADRNGTDIELGLSRDQSGVHLVLTYRCSVAASVKALTGADL